MILDLNMRPTVSFNSANHEHRKWFAEFQRKRTWGRCPVRFVVPGDSFGADLVATIQKNLLEYYVAQEFIVKTPRKRKAS
jgi:hypothetical protein